MATRGEIPRAIVQVIRKEHENKGVQTEEDKRNPISWLKIEKLQNKIPGKLDMWQTQCFSQRTWPPSNIRK